MVGAPVHRRGIPFIAFDTIAFWRFHGLIVFISTLLRYLTPNKAEHKRKWSAYCNIVSESGRQLLRMVDIIQRASFVAKTSPAWQAFGEQLALIIDNVSWIFTSVYDLSQ